MATTASNGSLREALTFDDVLLKPGLSDVLPTETDVRTRITREIALNIPIITSAMDTVTEATMAIAMAQAGGLGVIHRNLDPEQQAALVRQVKKFESGMVVNPLTIDPDATLADALTLMKQNGISGIPVVEGNGATQSRQARRHSDQSRRPLCDRSGPESLRAHDQGAPGHGARKREPAGSQAPAAPTPHRKAAGRRR